MLDTLPREFVEILDSEDELDLLVSSSETPTLVGSITSTPSRSCTPEPSRRVSRKSSLKDAFQTMKLNKTSQSSRKRRISNSDLENHGPSARAPKKSKVEEKKAVSRLFLQYALTLPAGPGYCFHQYQKGLRRRCTEALVVSPPVTIYPVITAEEQLFQPTYRRYSTNRR